MRASATLARRNMAEIGASLRRSPLTRQDYAKDAIDERKWRLSGGTARRRVGDSLS